MVFRQSKAPQNYFCGAAFYWKTHQTGLRMPIGDQRISGLDTQTNSVV